MNILREHGTNSVEKIPISIHISIESIHSDHRNSYSTGMIKTSATNSTLFDKNNFKSNYSHFEVKKIHCFEHSFLRVFSIRPNGSIDAPVFRPCRNNLANFLAKFMQLHAISCHYSNGNDVNGINQSDLNLFFK